MCKICSKLINNKDARPILLLFQEAWVTMQRVIVERLRIGWLPVQIDQTRLKQTWHPTSSRAFSNHCFDILQKDDHPLTNDHPLWVIKVGQEVGELTCLFNLEWSKSLFHDGGHCDIETSPLICFANQWTDFYVITAPVMKELRKWLMKK